MKRKKLKSLIIIVYKYTKYIKLKYKLEIRREFKELFCKNIILRL
jgi:hypothetical protein